MKGHVPNALNFLASAGNVTELERHWGSLEIAKP